MIRRKRDAAPGNAGYRLAFLWLVVGLLGYFLLWAAEFGGHDAQTIFQQSVLEQRWSTWIITHSIVQAILVGTGLIIAEIRRQTEHYDQMVER